MTQQKKQSAGIVVFRQINEDIEIFLVHPGGPFWVKKDLGAWSIPKGEFTEDEDPLDAAKREFLEETGIKVKWKDDIFKALQPVKMKSGKIIHAWACENNFETGKMKSNTFPLEWPPKSGKIIEVPEVDKWEWFFIKEAEQKINPAQIPLIEETIQWAMRDNK
jgi:predicted NUDIX family NTP pyrophosphohydrolase